MAIAFVAKGATATVDTSTGTTGQISVDLPAGHASGHLLVMYVLTDDNSNVLITPTGWTRLLYITAGTSTQTPYTARPRLKVYVRIDDGTLSSPLTLTFSTAPWPVGKPSVVAHIEAYSGVDATAPIGEWSWQTTVATTAAQAHPILTTTRANDWLITYRAVSADSPGATFTVSGGTNTERQDDFDTIPELASATYDSNGALAAGAQTQRTTTASRAATYGSLMVSIAIQPPSAAGATTAPAGSAEALGTAYDATVTAQDGSWDFCGPGGLPVYNVAIDWNGDGFSVPGATLNLNPYVATDLSDWTVINSTIARTTGIIGPRVPVLRLTSSTGSSPRTTSGHRAAVTGQSYRVHGWVYAPVALPSTAALWLNWYDAGDVFLSSSITSATLTPGTWTLLDATFTAPASTAKASISMVESGTPGAGFVLYGYGLLLIDPAAAGTSDIPSPGDDITTKVLESGIAIGYGRDQDRQLSPASVGSASLSVINTDRGLSPEFTASLLYGDLEPARQTRAKVTYGGNVYPLMLSKIDDYNIKADLDDRTVDFTFLDGMADLQNVKLSTAVYASQRTGALISTILDLAGWTGPRDLDLGATVVPYWWVEQTDALTAIQDLVKSEGTPSLAYQAPDGTFVFRDRHHRLLRGESTEAQATFSQPVLMDCTAPAVTGGLDFTAPFVYAHGWRDIVNSVTFEISERSLETDYAVVWNQEDTVQLGNGEAVNIGVSASDPFMEAITPVEGTDFTRTGAGTVSVLLSRDSGQSAVLTLMANGGSATISGLQLRAKAVSVRRNIKVSREDTDSITQHGEKSYPETAPWANANDADAIAGMILLHYAKRRPTIQLRVTSQDPAHFVQVLSRTVSDRIHVRYDEMGIDSDFYIEHVTHTVQRMNAPGRPPVHSVVFGCEKNIEVSANPFTFDKRGAGFDQGVFDPIQADSPDTVFIFDHPTQGKFDTGLFGT